MRGRALRSWIGCFLTRAERRELTVAARECRRHGHDDRYVEWFGSHVPRCSRCLTFPVVSLARGSGG